MLGHNLIWFQHYKNIIITVIESEIKYESMCNTILHLFDIFFYGTQSLPKHGGVPH